MVNEFQQRVAIVTGAARGVGEAIAARLARGGAHVIVADLLEEQGQAVAKSVGGRFRKLDVSDAPAWKQTVDEVVAEHGRLDVLVNNASILHMGSLANTPPETFRRVLEVNTLGAFLGIRSCAPAMCERGSGSIVNVASIDGLGGMNGLTAYCASKWGMRGLAKAAALELGRSGVRVNTVCPGGGNPEMFAPWIERMAPFMEETLAYLEQRALPGPVPIDRIAESVAWLACDASAGCTGIDLPVDGGATAGDWIAGFNTL